MVQQFNFKRLEQPIEADWPVEVSVPQDGGAVTKETFVARFRLLKADVMQLIVAGPSSAESDGRDLYRQFFIGFGKGTDEALTEEVFNNLVDTPFTREALLTAYRKFATGIAVKN